MMKAIYFISDLMPLLGYRSANGCRKFLLQLNVKCVFVGKKYIVYLSDIQMTMPELSESIYQAELLNDQIKTNRNLSDADISSYIEDN